MQLELSKEQFQALLRLTFLGEMVINGDVCGDEETDIYAKQLYEFLVEKAAKEKVFEGISYDKVLKKHFLSFDQSMDFYEYLYEYCENNFGEQLVEIIAQNMIRLEHGEGAERMMKPEKYEKLMSTMIDSVDEEFRKYDYKNVILLNLLPKK